MTDEATDSKVQITAQVSPELRERVTQAAAERGFSSGVFIGKALEYYLDDLIPVAELELTRRGAGKASAAEPADA